MKIEPLVYTLDNGKTYQIEFNRTKNNINFEHYKTVKYLSINDLIKLRDTIDKITMNLLKKNETFKE